MNWYVIQCKANQQQRAESNLSYQGFDIFSPSIQIERIVRRKRVIRLEAAFPGYIFIKLDLDKSDWRALSNTRGVSKVVSFGGCPLCVSGDLINALYEQFGVKEKPFALFKTGDRVQITDGCFKNIEAIVSAVTPDERIIVLLKILHSPQDVAFPINHLARVG